MNKPKIVKTLYRSVLQGIIDASKVLPEADRPAYIEQAIDKAWQSPSNWYEQVED